MASPPPAAAKASRWGSFLTGLESRLDTILADEESASKLNSEVTASEQAKKKDALPGPVVQPGSADSPARTTSSNKAQDRLNEKLARARAARNANKSNEPSAATSNVPSRTASPANVTASSRVSTDSNREDLASASVMKASDPLGIDRNSITSGLRKPEAPKTNILDLVPSEPEPARPSIDSYRSISTRQSLDQGQANRDMVEEPKINGHAEEARSELSDPNRRTTEQLRSDYEEAELRRQEETHDFLERIDALQSKLQYLTKEAAETARRASSSAKPGTNDEKLAAKDEKIALLMEEGLKLSQTELKHMSIIKKLRAKSGEDEKRLADSRKLAERHEKVAREMQEKVKKAEAAESWAVERTKTLPKIEKELETLKAEREAHASAVESLQGQLSKALADIEEAQRKADSKALEGERKRAIELADELSRVKIEQDMNEKGYLTEIRGLKETAERHKERARVAEIERQGEQNILESRLEAFRARAEEASAGSTGDVQAKLLRQIETLTNQYAIASKNWQGIEGSLLSRVTTLENEREEIAKREADVRRKVRESNSRARSLEEDRDKANAESKELHHELMQQSTHLATLQEKLSKTEFEVTEARKDLQAEREAWEARQAQRIEEERAKQREELARSPDPLYQQLRNQPLATSSRHRKSSNPDKYSFHGRYPSGLAISGTAIDRPVSRRSSTQRLRSSEIRGTPRQDSNTFTQQSSINGAVPETPSITVDNQYDFFDGVRTPASPEHTINDMISASTAGAGPSVQLVERMSAAVRRLESEKAASKDELARLSQQRDEAREQVVSLMREAEEKRKLDERVKDLEKGKEQIQERYLTTLEMLGERSERVEELTADVADLKQMYRELVDSTMR